MAKAKNAVPEGHHTVTPQLTLDNAAQAIEWYKKALGAEEVARAVGPDGKIMHAEMRIGDSRIMLNDAMMGGEGPQGDRRVTGVALALRGGLRRAVQPRRRGGRAGCSTGRWGRWRISSGAIAAEPSPTRTGTSGRSRRTRKISRREEMQQRQEEFMKTVRAAADAQLVAARQRISRSHENRRNHEIQPASCPPSFVVPCTIWNAQPHTSCLRILEPARARPPSKYQMFPETIGQDIRIGLRVLRQGTCVLRARGRRARARHLRRHDDVQRRQRRDAARILISERRPAGERQLHGSVERQLLRRQRPDQRDGLRGDPAGAAVVRAAGRVPQRFDGQRHGRRQAAALHRRLHDRRLPAASSACADDGPRFHGGGQHSPAPKRWRSSATASGSATSAARQDIVGKRVRINGKPATIIGVMPKGFAFPINEELWLPLFSEFPPRPRNDPASISPAVLGLLKPGVSLDQANAEFTALAKRLRRRVSGDQQAVQHRAGREADQHVHAASAARHAAARCSASASACC